jgi:hypothetical protein
MFLHRAANLPLGGGAAFFDDLLELIENNRSASLGSGSHAIDDVEHIGEQRHAALGVLSMKTIRTYSLQSEADLARIALEGADIPAVVVGVGIGMKGGVLLVPEDRIEAALKVTRGPRRAAVSISDESRP